MTGHLTDTEREAQAAAEASALRLAADLCAKAHNRDEGEPGCDQCYWLACEVMDTPWLAAREAVAREEGYRLGVAHEKGSAREYINHLRTRKAAGVEAALAPVRTVLDDMARHPALAEWHAAFAAVLPPAPTEGGGDRG